MSKQVTSRMRRKLRIRAKVNGTPIRPRLSVFRSNKQLFIQLIDDVNQKTLLGMSDRLLAKEEKNKLVRAKSLGASMAKAALAQKINKIVFDRGGYLYHGRVKSLAEGLREGGLQF